MQMREKCFLIVSLAVSACGGRSELDSSISNVGGSSPIGGATSTSGNQATGCTGSLETIQFNTGLCAAKMATITAPGGNSDYKIDATEVTKGQYDAWLATNPALPPRTDPNCGYVSNFAEQNTFDVFTGTDADHHPVVWIDWCDAYEYCKGLGKRLCGAIGGGSNDWDNYTDSDKSQWHRACSSGGVYDYPYGPTYQASTCNGADFWNDNSSTMDTVAVGSLTTCATSAAGFAGVYDLSGNVWEWEDSCFMSIASATCRVRGGAFGDTSDSLSCGSVYGGTVNFVEYYIGFRCCSV